MRNGSFVASGNKLSFTLRSKTAELSGKERLENVRLKGHFEENQ